MTPIITQPILQKVSNTQIVQPEIPELFEDKVAQTPIQTTAQIKSMAKAQITTRPEPHLEIAEVTPELAEEWLKKNAYNFRKLRPKVVQNMAESMIRGEWDLNGSSNIVFDKAGHLINGQHRLSAVVAAKIPIKMTVFYGADNAINIDTGMLRQVCDYLSQAGYKNAYGLAAALRHQCRYMKSGLLRSAFNSSHSDDRPTNDEILKTLENYPEMTYSVSKTSHRTIGYNDSSNAFLHFQMSLRDKDKANFFIDSLYTGINISITNNSPIWCAREKLIKDKNSIAKMPKIEKIALVIKAWNAWIAGRETRRITWMVTNRYKEPFPNIEG